MLIVSESPCGGHEGSDRTCRKRKEGRSRPAAARPDKAVKLVNSERMWTGYSEWGLEGVESFDGLKKIHLKEFCFLYED